MEKSIYEKLNSTLMSEIAKESSREYQQEKRKARRQAEESFFSQTVDYRSFVFAPEGYEGAMLALYCVTLPYLAGLSFLFLFIARAQAEYFVKFDLTSFFIIWAMGYEVCAGGVLVVIFIGWLKYLSDRRNKEPELKKNVF